MSIIFYRYYANLVIEYLEIWQSIDLIQHQNFQENEIRFTAVSRIR